MNLTIQMTDVHRHYETPGGVVRALDGVSVQIDPGGFVAIAGPSGSGKTTLLNLVGALDQPTSGTVALGDVDLAGLSRTEAANLRRDRVGFVFQAYNLIPVLSAIENVEYVLDLQGVSKEERHERALAALEEVGLAEQANRRPAELSGGQQQRVAVARAMVHRPMLVLADEPTANLDSVTGEQLLDTMVALNETHGTTFVFSTHDGSVMARAQRMLRLRDGKIEDDEQR